MAIKGSLRDANLADVFQLLALGRKTGCLSVSDQRNSGRVYFVDGMIAQASIANRRDRLGDLLVRHGLLSPITLAEAVDEQRGQNAPRLGEILLRHGAISPDQLEQYVRIQVEEAVYALFSWTRGVFRFEASEVTPAGELAVSIPTEQLLLEGARRVDEWDVIRRRVTSPDLIFTADRTHGDPARAQLTDRARQVLALLDGRRTVREIGDESGLLEFETAKAIYELLQAGYARVSGRRRPPIVPLSHDRREEHRNLGVAMAQAGLLEEAEREFRQVLELDPEDGEARYRLASLALRRGKYRTAVCGLMKTIEDRGPTAAGLNNLALGLEVVGREREALLVVEEGLAVFTDDAPLLLARGIVLTKLHRFPAAVQAFDRFAEGPGTLRIPPPGYFIFSVVALGACGRLEAARQRADVGVGHYPHHPAVLLHAGLVADRGGAPDEAEKLYRRVLKVSPGLMQAQNALADVLRRRGAIDEAALLLSGVTGVAG